MPEAPVPGQTVGQPNPPQPAGYNPPATPAPQDHPPQVPGNVDSSGGFMPNGPIPSVAYTPAYTPPPAPPGATGYTGPGTGYTPPMQGYGVVIQQPPPPPPNTQPGLSGGGAAYGGGASVPTIPPAGPNQWTTGAQSPAGTQPTIAGPVGGSPVPGAFAGPVPLTPMPPGPTTDLWLEGYANPPAQAPPNTPPGYQSPAAYYPGAPAQPATTPMPYLSLRPILLPLTAGKPTGLLAGGAGRIVYVFARESTGSSTASFSLWDGNNATGQLLMPTSLLAGESFRDNFYPHGIPYIGDLYFSSDSGSFTGAVYVVPEELFILAERSAERALQGLALYGQ